MAKHGPGTLSKTSLTQPNGKVSPPPVIFPAARVGKHKAEARRTGPDPEISAAGEKSQREFQRIFGINLKTARLKSKLKQSEVAAVTGLTQQYLSLIEAGQQNVTIRTMALLAKVVDHDLLDLLKHALGMPSKED